MYVASTVVTSIKQFEMEFPSQKVPRDFSVKMQITMLFTWPQVVRLERGKFIFYILTLVV